MMAENGEAKVQVKGHTIKLIAQPKDEKPYLVLFALDRGEYQECSIYSVRTFIRFSDIGSSVWQLAKELDKNAKISSKDVHWIAEDYAWSVSITTKDIDIILTSVLYRRLGFKYVSSCYIEIELTGKEEAVSSFIEKLVVKLGRIPTDFQDWEVIVEKSGVSKEEIEERWRKYTLQACLK